MTVAAVTTNEQEASNLARLLQSIDEDQDPNNGIVIATSTTSNAANLSSLNVKSELTDTQLQQIIATLFPSQARTGVSKESAELHASSSERLGLIAGNEVYDAIIGNKTYPTTYNVAKLSKNSNARLRLYIWQKWQRPMIQILLDSRSDIVETTEAVKRRGDNYIELADAVGDLVLLSGDVKKLKAALKAGESGNEYVFKIAGGAVNGIISTIPAINGVLTEPEDKQQDESNGAGIAKAGFYAFGSLGGDVGSGVNSVKEIAKASSNNPYVAPIADALAVFTSNMFDNALEDLKAGRIKQVGKAVVKNGVASLVKDSAILVAKGANSYAAAPILAQATQGMNSILVASDVLNIWYQSGADADWANKAIYGNTTTKGTTLDWVDEVAKNYQFEKNWILADDFDRDLAYSIVSEQIGRGNLLARTYTSRLGKGTGDPQSSVVGLPTSTTANVTYSLSVSIDNGQTVDEVQWSVNDGRTTTKFNSKDITVAFTKTGTYVIQALTKLNSNAFSTASAQTIVAPVAMPSVMSVLPLAAQLNQSLTLVVTGRNLPLTSIASLADAECQAPSGNTASGFSQICVPRATGSKTVTVKTQPGGSALHTATISVLEALLPSQLIAFSNRANAMVAGWTVSPSVSFVNGRNGGTAAKFSGTSSPGQIRIPNNANMIFSNGATFDMWVRLDSMTGMNGFGSIVNNGLYTMNLLAKSHDITGMALNTNFGGFSYVQTYDSTWSTGCTVYIDKPNIPLGEWFRVTMVASSVIGTKVYVNKRLTYACTSFPNFSTINSQDLFVGQYSSFWYPLDGAIQDIKIYKSALTSLDVQNLQD